MENVYIPLYLAVIVYGGYLACAWFIAGGIRQEAGERKDFPSVSIVIPVRNEESRLSTLFESLLNLDYPVNQLEIIIVNDQSEDQTREIALSYKTRFQCRFIVRDVMDEPDGKLRAKTRPLAQGLDIATGEIVLMTDADCYVSRDWVKGMVSHFSPQTGMVCGITVPSPRNLSPAWIHYFEILDWLFLLGSSIGIGKRTSPQALIGNNYSIRKETYQSIGTFRNLTFSDIDDVVLLRAVEQTEQWQVACPVDPHILISTEPVLSFWELVRQRRRWIKGILHTGWSGKAALFFAILVHLLLLPLVLWNGTLFLFAFLALMLGNGAVIARMMLNLNQQRFLWLIPIYPVFAALYGIPMIWLILFHKKKVRWKARDF